MDWFQEGVDACPHLDHLFQVMCPQNHQPRRDTSTLGKSPTKDFKSLGTAPVIDVTDDDNPPWEHLEVRPQSLILSSSTTRSYTCMLKSGGWTDDNTNRPCRMRVDLRSIIEVVLRPRNGYPVNFRVSREEGSPFTGNTKRRNGSDFS